MFKSTPIQFFHFKNPVQFGWKSFLILIIGLLLTITVTYFAQSQIEDQSNQKFTSSCKEIKLKIASRLHAQAQLLRTGSALFAASDHVSREQWKAFYEESAINENLPGMLGLGFSVIIPKDQLDHHLQSVRKEGFPEYSVKPHGDRDLYTSIIYLEPLSGNNLRAFGYDMFSEPIRRKAMELSRDSDLTILSGKIILLQESEENPQPGILMYAPVYRNGLAENTLQQRREAIIGWTYSPIRLNDLMNSILDKLNLLQKGGINLQIFDDSISVSSLLFNSQNNNRLRNFDSHKRSLTVPVEFHGKKWELYFTQSSRQSELLQSKILLLLFGGISISVLLFLLSASLFNTKKRAQQIAAQLTLELKESEERLREVLENSLDASYKRNLKTDKYDYLSPVFKRLTGYTPEEMGTMSLELVQGLIHPDDKAESEREIAAALSNIDCKTAQLDYRFKHKDGEYRWIHDRFTVVRNEQGQPIALIGSVSDITNRKVVEEALQNEKFLLRTVIDNIPDSIYCMDVLCRKTLANLTDLSYMGAKSEADVLGKDDFDFYPKEIAEIFIKIDQSVIQTGQPVYNFDETFIDKNGDKRWLLSSKLPMRNKDGQIIGLIGIGRDITDRKLAEEEVKLKNKELQRVNSEKDKFFSIISHDLRSPFNGFLGLTQIMAEDLPTLTMEEIQGISLMLKNSATNLFRLLENLLEWAKIQQGLIPFDPQQLSIRLIVNDILILITETAKSKNIAIYCDIDDELKVTADSNMLQAIIRNLVLNAIKFTNRGGKIILSARETSDSAVEISINDNGIGMSSTTVDGLFRLDVNTSRKGTEGETSTGLGLIICKDFIEKHGGNIRVESQEEAGSTFFIFIPCKI